MITDQPDLTWTDWYPTALPAAASLPEWVACGECGTRTPQVAARGLNPDSQQLQAVVSYCPTCGATGGYRLDTTAE